VEAWRLRQHRIDQPHAVGQLEGKLGRSRNGGPQRQEGDLQRVHLEGVLPAHVLGVNSLAGWERSRSDLPVLPDSADDLGSKQVRVDGMSVHAVVEDSPDLRAVGQFPDLRGFERALDDVGGRGREGEREDEPKAELGFVSPSMPLIRP